MSGEGHNSLSGIMDRRRFLKLSGAGLACTALLINVSAIDGLAQPSSSLEAEFEEAAGEYRVPVELLLAMGYVNTRWEMPPPPANEYKSGDLHGWGSYGIMALVRNPTADTLGDASRLTRISASTLVTDRKSNILGGAALLSRSQGEKPATLGEWFGAVDGKGGNGKLYEAVAGIGGGGLFAEQVFETLQKGASERIKSGEQITLAPQSLTARTTKEGEVL